MSETPTGRPARPAPADVDPVEVRRLIDAFTAQEARDPKGFAEALADNIMDPDPAETAAFRHEELVAKSWTAAKWLIANTNQVMADRSRKRDLRRRTEYFRQAVAREERVLRVILDGVRAQSGVLPTQRNPRQRALRRLADENLKGPLEQGRFRDILEEEKEKDRQAEAARKEARRQARKAARKRAR